MKPLLPWVTRTLALVAIGLSAYLTWISATTATAIGCDFSAFDCEAALASPWAKWLGVPVAAGGLLCYVVALVGSLLAGRSGFTGSFGWRLLEVASPLAVGAGIWFTFIQITALESFCLYCVLTHACGLLMAIAATAWRLTQDDEGNVPAFVLSAPGTEIQTGSVPPSLGIPTALGVAGVIALAVGQVVWSPATLVVIDDTKLDGTITLDGTGESEATETNLESDAESITTAKPIIEPVKTDSNRQRYPRVPNGSRKLSLLNGQLNIDAYDHAVLGSPEAPHLVVEFMDYACPHCREFHDTLTEAVKRFDGEIGVIIMPIPGEVLCNKYVQKARPKSAGACYAAKLSLAVSRLAPEDFEQFHEWMLEPDTIRRRTTSLIEARRHTDNEELSKRLRDNDGSLKKQINQYVELAAALGRNNRFGLPAQILGDRFIAGTPASIDDLCKAWAEAFDIDLPKADIPF